MFNLDFKMDMREIDAEIQRSREEAPRTARALAADVVEFAMNEVVTRSPVWTGAYRASHVVKDGENYVYKGPDYQQPNAVRRNPPDGIYEAANPQAARAAAVGHLVANPKARFEIVNERYYASFLEFGTARMAPRAIYGSAAVATDEFTRRLMTGRTV